MNARRIGRAALAAAAISAAAFGAASCARTDVVARFASSSFAEAAKASGARYDAAAAAWVFESAAGDRFLLSAAPAFSLDAAPFLAAGLVPEKLAAADGVSYAIEDGRLVLRFELGVSALPASARESAAETFAAILKARRDLVGYHAQLDHYGIALGGGNMFEWAKDLSKNDKDLVWVLEPGPLAAAGADPDKIGGWLHGTVEMMEGARKFQVKKLLRPFDLK